MQELQKEVKNYVVVFFDKSIKKVTEIHANKLLELSCSSQVKGVELDGGYYRFANIVKILTEKDYYEQYPDMRPPSTMENFSEIVSKDEYIPSINYIEKNKSKLASLIKGIEKHINSSNYNGSDKPKKILKRMKEKMKILEEEGKVSDNYNYNIKNKPSETKMKTYEAVKNK